MYASGYAFREAINAKAGKNSPLKPDEVFKNAAEGDPICREIVEEAIPYTGYAFASLSRITDIYKVVLLGAYIDGGEYLLNLLYDNMAERLPGVAKRNLSLQLGNKHSIETVLEAAAAPAIAGHFRLQTSELRA